MADLDSKKGDEILTGDDPGMVRGLTRRDFVKYTAGTVACLYLVTLTGCGGGSNTSGTQAAQWPIAKDVFTTAQQQVLPVPVSAAALQINPRDLALYSAFGYDAWHVGPGTGLPYTVWNTIMASGYVKAPNAARLLSFFTMTDIHIADKESPAQPLYVGWIAANGREPARYFYRRHSRPWHPANVLPPLLRKPGIAGPADTGRYGSCRHEVLYR